MQGEAFGSATVLVLVLDLALVVDFGLALVLAPRVL